MLGAIEGVTEFLPISSTGHLTIAEKLLGYSIDDPDSPAEMRAELDAVTPDDVVRIAGTAWDNGLLLTPHHRSANWTGLTAAPVCSPSAVTGNTHPALGTSRLRLVVGAEGVSIVDPDGDAATVRFDALSAMIAWPDGGRMLIGHDGVAVRLEPTLYRGAGAAVAWLDQRVPAEARADQRPRDPSQIPQPRQAAPGEFVAPRSAAGPVVALVFGIPFALVLLFMAVVFVVAIGSGDEVAAMIVALVITLAALAGVAVLLRWAIRGLRARRR